MFHKAIQRIKVARFLAHDVEMSRQVNWDLRWWLSINYN